LSVEIQRRNESEPFNGCDVSGVGFVPPVQRRPMTRPRSVVVAERTLCDPKDGELCLNRTKSEETLMEVRSGSDVQIDRLIWV
jgi:hypothetical protein